MWRNGDADDDRRKANSENHQGEGQTVLEHGTSARFANNPQAGRNDDNIYTSHIDSTINNPRRERGVLDVKPGSPDFDTVLIPVTDERLNAASPLDWDTTL